MPTNKIVQVANAELIGLPESAYAKLCSVFEKKTEVERVIVYGSRAKGNYKPGSDIDLTMIGEHLDQRALAQIIDSIDDLMLPYKVDLSVFTMLKHAELEEHISRVGLLFFIRTK